MFTAALKIIHNHLFITIDGNDWLINTGAPRSFGNCTTLSLDGQTFSVSKPHPHMTTFNLSLSIDHDIYGLLGTDILNNFNILFDLSRERVTFSTRHIDLKGEHLKLSSHLGTPAISTTIDQKHFTMFFDTGAPVSYLQDDSLSSYPSTGTIEDYYPETGHFTTEAYAVEMQLGREDVTLTCGSLPLELDIMVQATGANGIVGNDLVSQREIGYFALEQELVIGQDDYSYEQRATAAL